MQKLRPRLTFANVVSCLAMFVALGGSAYAATQLKKNSVGTKQLKNGAVTTTKIAKGTRAALVGSTGPKGEPGLPGAPATTLFAQIRSDGTVNSSGSPVTAKRIATGIYYVDFGREITHCAAFASQGGNPSSAGPGSATSASQGYAPQVNIFSHNPADEEEVTAGFPLANSIEVITHGATTEADSSFYIAVFC